MRRFGIGLVVAVMALTVLGMTALAVPDGFCRDKPEHPACQEEPPPPDTTTTTTTTVADSGLPACAAEYTLTGTRGNLECEWTPSEASNEATVAATWSGELTRLVFFVRDDSPGDICLLEEWDRPIASPVQASFPLVYGAESYWDSPTHWCHRFDPVDGTRADLNGDPLHVQVTFRARRGTIVQLTLTP